MSRKETTLGPHIDLISGPAFKSQSFTCDPSDIPLVKGENIGQGMILWDKSKFWPRGDEDSYLKFKLQPDDVVLAMDRPWVSAGLKYAVINERDPEALLVQRVARIRGSNGLSSKFLRYVVSSPEFSGYIKNIGSSLFSMVKGISIYHNPLLNIDLCPSHKKNSSRWLSVCKSHGISKRSTLTLKKSS